MIDRIALQAARIEIERNLTECEWRSHQMRHGVFHVMACHRPWMQKSLSSECGLCDEHAGESRSTCVDGEHAKALRLVRSALSRVLT